MNTIDSSIHDTRFWKYNYCAGSISLVARNGLSIDGSLNRVGFVHEPNSTIGNRAKTFINRSSTAELKKIALYVTGRERIVYYAIALKYINARVKRA